MANTYTQLYFHIVFAVKGRNNLIAKNWKDELYKYITGIISNKNQKLIAINGMPNHIHVLISTKPDCNLSDLVRDIKSCSSKWINAEKLALGKFEWQTGFGAFTVSKSGLGKVVDYIQNQETHHLAKTFKQEYIEFLNANNIDYRLEYIFKSE